MGAESPFDNARSSTPNHRTVDMRVLNRFGEASDLDK